MRDRHGVETPQAFKSRAGIIQLSRQMRKARAVFLVGRADFKNVTEEFFSKARVLSQILAEFVTIQWIEDVAEPRNWPG